MSIALERRRYMGNHGTTDIYQTYDYLEANGVVYIDTGYVPSASTIISTKVLLIDNMSCGILGSRTSYTASDRFGTIYDNSGGAWQLRADFNSDIYRAGIYMSGGLYTITIQSGQYTYNGNTFSIAAFDNRYTLPLYLFNYNTGGSIFNLDITGLRLYETIFSTTSTQRDFIPCQLLQDTTQTWDGETHYAGECGMWDMVTDLFYGNANNTGSFSVGND